MATIIAKRPATVSFGEDIKFARRGSRAYSVQHDKRDADLILRRQSIKYQFPNAALEADVKDTDVDSDVDEDEIRRHVYGKPISEMSFVGIDTSVRRPTVSSARRSVVWAHDRKLYEEKNRQQVEEFKSQPYMKHQYPSLRKHYPGTWKLSTRDQIQATTERLAHAPAPTAASLHLHKYHSLLYRLLDENNIVPYSTNLQRRPNTSVY